MVLLLIGVTDAFTALIKFHSTIPIVGVAHVVIIYAPNVGCPIMVRVLIWSSKIKASSDYLMHMNDTKVAFFYELKLFSSNISESQH